MGTPSAAIEPACKIPQSKGAGASGAGYAAGSSSPAGGCRPAARTKSPCTSTALEMDGAVAAAAIEMEALGGLLEGLEQGGELRRREEGEVRGPFQESAVLQAWLQAWLAWFEISRSAPSSTRKSREQATTSRASSGLARQSTKVPTRILPNCLWPDICVFSNTAQPTILPSRMTFNRLKRSLLAGIENVQDLLDRARRSASSGLCSPPKRRRPSRRTRRQARRSRRRDGDTCR